MKDILLDVLKQTDIACEALCFKVSGNETVVECHDNDKNLFVHALLKQPLLMDFEGSFGLSNTKLLSGLLNFANYQTDDAVFSVKKKTDKEGMEMIEQFEFRNPVTGNDADFRMMNSKHLPEQAKISNIPWDIEISPSKSKYMEFQQLLKMYADVDSKAFGIRTVDGNLQFFIGDETSSTHRISMVMEKDVKGKIKPSLDFATSPFTNILSLIGNNSSILKITNKGVLSVVVETAFGVYTYFIRANR